MKRASVTITSEQMRAATIDEQQAFRLAFLDAHISSLADGRIDEDFLRLSRTWTVEGPHALVERFIKAAMVIARPENDKESPSPR